MTKTSALICALLTIHAAAHAERADSFKETKVSSREALITLSPKVSTLDGAVEIRRGTLLIRADHGVVTIDAEGYQHAVLSSHKNGNPVFFRQKRDGEGNRWMEGEALRVEYDEKTEVVDLLEDAKARRTTDGELTDEITGEHISYVAREERYAVTQLPGSVKKGDRRGTLVLQPSRKDPLDVPSSAGTTSATASAPVPQ